MCFPDASAEAADSHVGLNRAFGAGYHHIFVPGALLQAGVGAAPSALNDTPIALRTAKRLQWSCETFAHGRDRA
jgi:hypothetical protein